MIAFSQNLCYPSLAEARSIIEEKETWQLYKKSLMAILKRQNFSKVLDLSAVPTAMRSDAKMLSTNQLASKTPQISSRKKLRNRFAKSAPAFRVSQACLPSST